MRIRIGQFKSPMDLPAAIRAMLTAAGKKQQYGDSRFHTPVGRGSGHAKA